MIEPEAVANVLESKLHPASVEYTDIGGKGEKIYEYTLSFDEYLTFALLKQQTQSAAKLGGIKLTVETIEPAIHLEENRVEARIEVSVVETQNRHELENRDLSEF